MTTAISPVYTPLHEKLAPITILGLDCDDPDALGKVLLQEKDILQKADIICGGRYILQTLERNPELAGRLLPLAPPLEPLFECLAALRAEGMRVVVLAEGDPLFYGIGASLARRLTPDAIKIRPAISSLQAACARISLPWHNMFFLSLHGSDDLLPLFTAIARNQPVCVLTSDKNGPDVLARILLDRGADWFRIHVFERMGKEGERIREMSLKECSQCSFGPCATAILLPASKPRYPILGLYNANLRGKNSASKPVRGTALELLRIYPQNIVWDIGAGSGLLALEACSLAHAGKVIAIEKHPDRVLDIQENRRLLGAVNLSICFGSAPDCLAGLPLPDRIFIGTGLAGQSGEKLLMYCVQALPPLGRLVAACISPECLSLCRNILEREGWSMEMLEIIAREIQYPSGKQISSATPVFMFAAQKS